MGALRSRFALARLFPARPAGAVQIRPYRDVSRTRQRTHRLRRNRRGQRALGQSSGFVCADARTNASAERVSHPSAQGYIARVATVPEGWPSGLRRTLGKRVYGKPYRGFESHSLRQMRLKLLDNGDGLRGRPSQCTPGLDRFSYSSGYVQARASRAGTQEATRLRYVRSSIQRALNGMVVALG